MTVEMFVLKSDEALLYLFRRGVAWRKPPLSVRSNACPQQFSVTVGHDRGVGHMEQMAGKTKNVCRHQNSNDSKHYFSGDEQMFKEIQYLISHARTLTTDRCSSRFAPCLHGGIIHCFALHSWKNKVTYIRSLQPDSE